jgi:hypothetical protein
MAINKPFMGVKLGDISMQNRLDRSPTISKVLADGYKAIKKVIILR